MVKRPERVTSALWNIRAVRFCPSPQIPIPLEREEVGRVAAWLWIYSICASQFSWAIQPRRICDLRKMGHAITSKFITLPNGKRVKELRLAN